MAEKQTKFDDSDSDPFGDLSDNESKSLNNRNDDPRNNVGDAGTVVTTKTGCTGATLVHEAVAERLKKDTELIDRWRKKVRDAYGLKPAAIIPAELETELQAFYELEKTGEDPKVIMEKIGAQFGNDLIRISKDRLQTIVDLWTANQAELGEGGKKTAIKWPTMVSYLEEVAEMSHLSDFIQWEKAHKRCLENFHTDAKKYTSVESRIARSTDIYMSLLKVLKTGVSKGTITDSDIENYWLQWFGEAIGARLAAFPNLGSAMVWLKQQEEDLELVIWEVYSKDSAGSFDPESLIEKKIETGMKMKGENREEYMKKLDEEHSAAEAEAKKGRRTYTQYLQEKVKQLEDSLDSEKFMVNFRELCDGGPDYNRCVGCLEKLMTQRSKVLDQNLTSTFAVRRFTELLEKKPLLLPVTKPDASAAASGEQRVSVGGAYGVRKNREVCLKQHLMGLLHPLGLGVTTLSGYVRAARVVSANMSSHGFDCRSWDRLLDHYATINYAFPKPLVLFGIVLMHAKGLCPLSDEVLSDHRKKSYLEGLSSLPDEHLGLIHLLKCKATPIEDVSKATEGDHDARKPPPKGDEGVESKAKGDAPAKDGHEKNAVDADTTVANSKGGPTSIQKADIVQLLSADGSAKQVGDQQSQKPKKRPSTVVADHSPLKKLKPITFEDGSDNLSGGGMVVSPIGSVDVNMGSNDDGGNPELPSGPASSSAATKAVAMKKKPMTQKTVVTVTKSGDRSLFDFGIGTKGAAPTKVPQPDIASQTGKQRKPIIPGLEGLAKVASNGNGPMEAGENNSMSAANVNAGQDDSTRSAEETTTDPNSLVNPLSMDRVKQFIASTAAVEKDENVIQNEISQEKKSGRDLKIELFGDESQKEDVATWKRLCSIGSMSGTLMSELNDLWEKQAQTDEVHNNKKAKKNLPKAILPPVMLVRLRALVASAAAIMHLASCKLPGAGDHSDFRLPTAYAGCISEMRNCETHLKKHKTQAMTKEDRELIEIDIDEYLQMQAQIDHIAWAYMTHLVPDFEEIIEDVKTFSKNNAPRVSNEYFERAMGKKFIHLEPLAPQKFIHVRQALKDEESNQKRKPGGGGGRTLKRKPTLE